MNIRIRAKLPQNYDHIGLFCGERAYVHRSGKHNAIDPDGREVLRKWYPMIKHGKANCSCSYSDGMICLLGDNGKFGYADRSGDIVLPFVYELAGYFEDGLACVMENGKYGLIDKSGSFVIRPEYDMLGRGGRGTVFDETVFDEELLFACRDGKFGFIDRTGGTVIPFVYDAPPKRMFRSCFQDGCAPVRQGERLFFINREGREILPMPENLLCTSGFMGGFAYMSFRLSDDRCLTGLMTRTGRWLVPPEYDYIGLCFDGRMRAERDGKTVFLDTNGKTVFAAEYDCIYDFTGGHAWVRSNGRWGALDTDGKVIIPFEAEYITFEPHMSGSGISIGDGIRYGWADINGREILPPTYDTEIHWEEGYAVTTQNGQWVILHWLDDDDTNQ